jgi:Flp pilus assembly protein TadB
MSVNIAPRVRETRQSRRRRPPQQSGDHMNTRGIAILALVLIVIVILAIWVF